MGKFACENAPRYTEVGQEPICSKSSESNLKEQRHKEVLANLKEFSANHCVIEVDSSTKKNDRESGILEAFENCWRQPRHDCGNCDLVYQTNQEATK